MAKEDVHKMAFCCPGFVGLFEWIMVIFRLKNVGCHISTRDELDIP
jgi:hypothetical protein